MKSYTGSDRKTVAIRTVFVLGRTHAWVRNNIRMFRKLRLAGKTQENKADNKFVVYIRTNFTSSYTTKM